MQFRIENTAARGDGYTFFRRHPDRVLTWLDIRFRPQGAPKRRRSAMRIVVTTDQLFDRLGSMERDAEKTKARLLAAASAEFAQYGIAGARVDRIAQAAATNKQMIYAYFGNKDGLFDATFSAYVENSLSLVDFDATDLPGYAGAMFDRFEDDPDALRLSTWYRLERPGGAGLKAVVSINKARLDRIRKAQADGDLAGHFDPVQLLTLIQSVVTSWATMNPEFAGARPPSRAYRRRTVVEAVERLLRDS